MSEDTTRASMQQKFSEYMLERIAVGEHHYGTQLYPFNNRKAIRDIVDELSDAFCYLFQLDAEWEDRGNNPIYQEGFADGYKQAIVDRGDVDGIAYEDGYQVGYDDGREDAVVGL